MLSRTDIDRDDEARPLLLLGLTIVFICTVLLLAGGRDDGCPPARGRSAGGGHSLLVPGSPVDSVTGSPIKDAPPVTIVNDVRETLRRLPLDRNNPPGMPPPPKRKPG